MKLKWLQLFFCFHLFKLYAIIKCLFNFLKHLHWDIRICIADSLCYNKMFKSLFWGFPAGAVVKNLPANAGDTDSSPGPGRSHMPRSN